MNEQTISSNAPAPLGHCDKCDSIRWRAKYRKSKEPQFYCEKCGRRLQSRAQRKEDT